MLFQIGADRFAGNHIHNPTHFTVTELGLGLTFKLWVWHLHRDDRSKPFANVFPLEVVFLFLEELHAAGVFVDGTGKGGLKTELVGPTFVGMDVVGIAVKIFGVGIGKLHRHVHNHIILFFFKNDDVLMKGLFVAV